MHSQGDYEGRKAMHIHILLWRTAMNPSAFSSQFCEQSSMLKCNVNCNGGAHQSTSSGEMSSERRGVKCKGKSKGQWTPAEDSLLLHLVEKYGQQQWARIATNLPGRRGKQCRERWQNHLRPDIKREEWSLEEECLLVKLHEQFGNKWAQIARRMPGRPENAIKNHWNATLRSKNRRKPRKVGESPSVLHDYIQRIHHSTTLSPTNTSQDGNELQKFLFNIHDDYVCQAPSSEEGSSSDLLEDVVGMALQQNHHHNNHHDGHHYDGHQYDHQHHHHDHQHHDHCDGHRYDGHQYDHYHHHDHHLHNQEHYYNHNHNRHYHDDDHCNNNHHHHHMASPPLTSLQSNFSPPHLGHDIDLFELVSSSVMS